jgi:hypothetical protein
VGVTDLLDGALVEVDVGFEALLNNWLDARYTPISVAVPFGISIGTCICLQQGYCFQTLEEMRFEN